MQKYLVVIECEKFDKKANQSYTTWTHTFCRKQDDAAKVAKDKADGKILRAWSVDWANGNALPQQLQGMVYSDTPAALLSFIEQAREQKQKDTAAGQKPRIRIKSEPPKQEVKSTKHVYMPYKLIEV